MAFFDELEESIRASYLAVLRKKHSGKDIKGKYLNCDSFRKIAEEVKNEIVNGQNSGSTVLEIANNIIFRILKTHYFVYENHQMATLIGYLYLKRQNVNIRNYSVNGITNGSTLDDIRALTASW